MLFDRSQRFSGFQGFARRRCPKSLARAITAKNDPPIRASFGAFGGQMLKADSQGDMVALNHRSAAFLASHFDVVFASNHTPHPGEKRLLTLASVLPRSPRSTTQHLEAAGPGWPQ